MILGTHAARRTDAWSLLSASLALIFLVAGPRQVLAAAPAWDYVYFPDTLPEDAPAGAWGTENSGQNPTLAGGRLSFNLSSNYNFYYRDDTLDPNFPTTALTFEWKSETLSAGYFDMGVYSSAGETSDLIFDGFFSRSDQQVLEFFTYYNAGSVDLPPLLAKGQHTYRIVRGADRADLYVDGVLQASLPASGSLIDEVYLHVASFYNDPPNYTALWDHVAYTRGAYTPEELPSPTRGGNNAPESLVAVSDLTISTPVSTQISSPLVVEARNTSNLPLGDVPVEFSITSPVPPGATGFQFVAKENRTNPAGRASTGFLLGNLPLEYNIKADCPSCTGTANSVAFRICGELPGELYRQNENKPGKQDYIRDRLANSNDPNDSIEQRGCALTAYTMLLNIFRSQNNLTYPDSTPGTLNKVLTPAGFDPVARLNLRRATPLFAGTQVQYVGAPKVGLFATVRDVMNAVDDSLKEGNSALIRLKSSTGAAGHTVTAVGRCGNTYRVLDPYTGTHYSFIDLDNLNGIVILGVRIFKRVQ